VEEKYGANSKKRGHEGGVGVLATETLDKEIFATLPAIKNKDPRVYDGTTTFYTPIDAAENKEKPMFLRDYPRVPPCQ